MGTPDRLPPAAAKPGGPWALPPGCTPTIVLSEEAERARAYLDEEHGSGWTEAQLREHVLPRYAGRIVTPELVAAAASECGRWIMHEMRAYLRGGLPW